jgi:hypothetical protein
MGAGCRSSRTSPDNGISRKLEVAHGALPELRRAPGATDRLRRARRRRSSSGCTSSPRLSLAKTSGDPMRARSVVLAGRYCVALSHHGSRLRHD